MAENTISSAAMDLYAFNYLTQYERAAVLWEHGSYLCTRHEGGCKIVLYHVDGFFAEIWYLPELAKVVWIRGFTSLEVLEPYLEMVDMEALLKQV